MEASGPFPLAPQQPRSQLSPRPPGRTHKVRSLGMWLKLDTGMVVMLLLFSVLMGNQSRSAPVQQESPL